jgi:hypothetical protein
MDAPPWLNMGMANEIDIEKIQESPHLLDMLLQMEDVLDSLDIYVFRNWYKGEVVSGPNVRRYWLDFTLRYKYDQMPDQKAAMRLIKHGIRVDFAKGSLKSKEYTDAEGQLRQGDHDPVAAGDLNEPEPDEVTDASSTVWLVTISIPRRLVAQMSSEQLDSEYEDEVEIDDVDDAKDTGIDDESAYMQDEDGSGEGGQGNPDDEAPPEDGAPQ